MNGGSMTVENFSCPCCKSVDVIHKEFRKSNGINGPGYRSWAVFEYWFCKNCGVMFQKV